MVKLRDVKPLYQVEFEILARRYFSDGHSASVIGDINVIDPKDEMARLFALGWKHFDERPPVKDECKLCGESTSYALKYGCPAGFPDCPQLSSKSKE